MEYPCRWHFTHKLTHLTIPSSCLHTPPTTHHYPNDPQQVLDHRPKRARLSIFLILSGSEFLGQQA
ncbi:hypothetical protein J6590_029212 [Homalodisca vitripennis]|nr:hypothetical protein J6590_029212 [Homalodisca vitripennis]